MGNTFLCTGDDVQRKTSGFQPRHNVLSTIPVRNRNFYSIAVSRLNKNYIPLCASVPRAPAGGERNKMINTRQNKDKLTTHFVRDTETRRGWTFPCTGDDVQRKTSGFQPRHNVLSTIPVKNRNFYSIVVSRLNKNYIPLCASVPRAPAGGEKK